MSKFTRVLTSLVVLALVLPVCAKDYKVGVAWIGKSSRPDVTYAGLEKALKEIAPEIQLELQKELKDAAALGEVIARFQTEKDAMVLMRSNGAEYLIKNPPTIPAFIGSCNNPMDLGVIKDGNAPEGKITGSTYSLSYDIQFETFKAIIPKIKSIALLMEKGHVGSAVDQKGTKAICEKLKIEYNEKFCEVYKNAEGKEDEASQKKTFDEVSAAVNEYKDKVTLILLGNQVLFMDNAPVVIKAAGATPVLSYSPQSVKGGALCGLTADDAKLGQMMAEQIVDVLKNGKAIKDVPVIFDLKPQLYINVKTAEALKIEIPYEILSVAKVVGQEEKPAKK